MPRIAVIVLMALTLSLPIPAMAQSATPAAPSPAGASGDFAGLVDIGGGRRLWLECRGHGSPTVLLEAGYRRQCRRLGHDRARVRCRRNGGPPRRRRVHARLRL